MLRHPQSRRPPRPVPRQLAALGLRPRKRLGQHFLADPAIAQQIVDLAAVGAGEPVIEIGPGLGILSEPLARVASRLFLIELDAALARHLTARFRTAAHVTVRHADAARVDFTAVLAGGSRGVGVGNLPYNVATAILAHAIDHRACFRRLVFMLQREVAERLAAAPGSRTYGSLSVLTQLHCDVHLALRVGRTAFEPPPQVESAVTVLDILPAPRVAVGDLARFARIVRALFTHRRKQLRNSTRGILSDPDGCLRAAGIDPHRRPETLSIAEFADLVREAR